MANYQNIQRLLPANDYRTYGRMDWGYVTIHNTANRMPAKNEVSYVHSRQGEVTYHFAIDDKECIQLLPLNKSAWHAGDGRGSGNTKSVAIEICYSLDKGDKRYPIAEDNASHKAAELLYSKGFGVDRLRKHQDWSGKYCPHRMLDNRGWEPFKAKVQGYLDKLNGFSKKDFIDRIAPYAIEAWKSEKILPSLTIAQAILESDWGRSELARNANALFGIKAHTDPTHKKFYTKTTWEYSNGKHIELEANFKAYVSWEESVKDRSKYLATRHIGGVHIYKDVIGETDYKKAANKIYKAGYATDPNYPKKLINIIVENDLTKYDTEGLSLSGKGVKMVDYGIFYVNDGDTITALNFINCLGDRAVMTKTSDATKFDAKTKIQIGGAKVEGVDIAVLGDNRIDTLDKANALMQKIHRGEI